MKLNEYPHFIASVHKEIILIEREIKQLNESVAFQLSSIDKAIAFDKELKNDAQRKAKRTQLMETDSNYIAYLCQLRQATEKREMLGIDLELYRNLFAVAKITARAAVFEKELDLSF